MCHDTVEVAVPLTACSCSQENQELWDLMQQDEVAELDTSAALEGLDLASSIPPNMRAMSPDTEQPSNPTGWENAHASTQPGQLEDFCAACRPSCMSELHTHIPCYVHSIVP